MLFGIIENKKFDLTCAGTTLKLSNHENILGKIIENKPFFNGQINNVCKTVNKKIITLIRINPFLKQLKNRLLNFSFIISQISYSPLIWMFLSKKFYPKGKQHQQKIIKDYSQRLLSLTMFIRGVTHRKITLFKDI